MTTARQEPTQANPTSLPTSEAQFAGLSIAGLSIVCVFNNPSVRTECLDTSIARYAGDVDIDYIPVNNVDHTFTSAGAALNHGARRAKHEVIAFAHQDVYLHSIDRIAEAAVALAGETWGMLGASGITAEGATLGRIRDRVQLHGVTLATPGDVDSLDEVLFLVRRDRILEHPLTEDPDLAWHAYAVEYGLRMRDLGLRVGAADMATTHNSLTTNLARLDVAHRRVGQLHPAHVPLRTTCGTVGGSASRWRDLPVLRDHRWRATWLKESSRAALARRALALPVVLSDIRDDIDLLAFSNEAPLHLVNVDLHGGFVEHAHDRLTLTRYDKPVHMVTVGSLAELAPLIESLPASDSVLVADLTLDDLHALRAGFAARADWLIGVQAGDDFWLLGGPVVRHLPGKWAGRRSVPLLSRSVIRGVVGGPGAASASATSAQRG